MKDLDLDKCINHKALIPIVRSVMFVEGGVEYKLYCFIEFVWARFNFDVRNKLIAVI